MECNYHKILERLIVAIWERIDQPYHWRFFDLWLADESDLDNVYIHVFQEILGETFNEEQIAKIKNIGINLEKIIRKWYNKWKLNNSTLEISKRCLKQKIYEYLIYQLNKQDIIVIIGNSC
jgi:hypothetical protein